MCEDKGGGGLQGGVGPSPLYGENFKQHQCMRTADNLNPQGRLGRMSRFRAYLALVFRVVSFTYRQSAMTFKFVVFCRRLVILSIRLDPAKSGT